MFKGTLILGAALFVVAQIGYKILHPGVPLFDAMGIAGALVAGPRYRIAARPPFLRSAVRVLQASFSAVRAAT